MKVAVIPARGGSKRIPRKNIREFAGKPMIAYSIKCALASGLFNRIIVSTDDPEVSDVAKRYGAETPFVRPSSLADEHAGTIPVIAHAVKWLQASGATPDAVCCIYATAPFVRADDLRLALEKLESGAWDYVFSATSYSFPIFRSFKQLPDGGLQMFFPEHFQTRSQDLEEAFHDAGQFYWGQPAAWCEERVVFGKNSAAFILPRWRVQDIDTPDDWTRAELMMTLLQSSSGAR
jgi:pseudaminic acid cytidylyltransferase